MGSKSNPNPGSERKPAGSAATPSRKKRFHVEKLEERIAPKKPSGGGQTSTGWSVISASIY